MVSVRKERLDMATIDDLIDDTGAYDCVECGKCPTVCHVAKLDKKDNISPDKENP